MIVWIIDPDQWPRALLRAELIERGYDAVGYLTVEDASRSVGSRFPDVIIVDLRNVGRDDVAQLFPLGVPVIGIASMPEPEWLQEFKWGALLRRPISIGQVADRVGDPSLRSG